MKIDRLLGIITILLQNEKVTAPALAERFEVSRRTINRDIADIGKAGIPIVTTQGANGGIAIIESYKIEKNLFSIDDLRAIFAGLASLDSIAQDKKYTNIIEKFSAHKDSLLMKNTILIDLSSHYKQTLAPQMELLQVGIENHLQVSFFYHNQNGQHCVEADPYLILFQWANWYLLGFDHTSSVFKLYKLNRILNLRVTDQSYPLQEIPPETLNFSRYFTDEIQAVILFEKQEAYRLIEEYGADSFTETPDGKLRFSFSFTNQNYLLSWVLGFGETAELIEPQALRPILHKRLVCSLEKYSDS